MSGRHDGTRGGRAGEVNGFPFNDKDSTASDGETESVTNAMEAVALRGRNVGQTAHGKELVVARNRGAIQTRNRLWEDMANKMVPPEDSEMMIARLEKGADGPIQRTYVEGLARDVVNETGVFLRIGLTFLPGANKPEVNRLEQINMAGKEPDQKDALWRVNTAATLLTHFVVMQDLCVVRYDRTAEIARKARDARDARMRHQSQTQPGPVPSSSHGALRKSSPTTQNDSLTIGGKKYGHVNIDSDCVKLVNDLRIGEWDVQATLIEVDMGSLLDLITNYRSLINQSGPEMSFQETEQLLETMIEDARRLCIRSPILFRMSTRLNIIRSQDTRYGINHASMFRTITTSKGVREIISLSASYYNSLDPAGTTDKTQALIRLKFLQMVVLLLSLLNDNDLAEIADFLQSTYNIKADRQHLELMFLKVIPLVSINSKVFLKAMIPTCDGYLLFNDEFHNPGRYWDIFIQRLLLQGFMLPGTVTNLGRERLSWIVNWPEQGFNSTEIFNFLQYHGGPLKTVNDIPPIAIRPEGNLDELTVLLTNGYKVIVSSADSDKITCLSQGTYTVQEARAGGRTYDLEILEEYVNEDLASAIRTINFVIDKVNTWQASTRRISFRIGRRSTDHGFLGGFQGYGKLTKHTAFLNGDVLAIAYKLDGRKTTKLDAGRNLTREIRDLRILLDHIEKRIGEGDLRSFHSEKRELKALLDEIRRRIDLTDYQKKSIYNAEEMTDEPIAKVLYPGGVAAKGPEVWNEYRAAFIDEYLHVEAKQSIVKSFNWISDEIVEVFLEQHKVKYWVTPLKPVEESLRDDEIQEGDIVVLAGRYMIIAAPPEDGDHDYGLIMTNWLKITGSEDQSRSNRGANRRQKDTTGVVTTIFR